MVVVAREYTTALVVLCHSRSPLLCLSPPPARSSSSRRAGKTDEDKGDEEGEPPRRLRGRLMARLPSLIPAGRCRRSSDAAVEGNRERERNIGWKEKERVGF
ncbi:hypothetical protein Dimus_016716 [Dionaea muscipula]